MAHTVGHKSSVVRVSIYTKTIGAVKAAGALPDGRYTALPVIDKLLISPVILYIPFWDEMSPTHIDRSWNLDIVTVICFGPS
ncbi:hypothetical protein CCM_00378 [Cordyceps militaris CM01]|uniref:Uncharacterized protein n=1 Tax=Cordyceps militaris (strain CM01) TaxID=983644 RepID=G3J3P8_CORMM|nr:uncharacterized protein CCM_00378 [Cordyceps militaris CM01]EGX95724.1 hypothetical protein CCM_00378 [Cordyceps militaris CM01]